MTLSVLISAFNNHPLTVVHVRECMNSTLIPDEIIVVNDGGTPELKEMLEKLEKKTKIIYARINEDIPWNYTGARNLGLWLSRGDYISIEDNDHIPTRDFYEKAVEELNTNPKISRIASSKRWTVDSEELLNKPMEEWEIKTSRPSHQDVTIIRREVFLKLKGYDERFAGQYGWSATDWKRRMATLGVESLNKGFLYVEHTPKSRGLSSRNWKLARRQRELQSPNGMLNFTYEFCEL